MPVFQIRESQAQERVLLVVPARQHSMLMTAATDLGALCEVAHDAHQAAEYSRRLKYDVIILLARETAAITALLLRLLKAEQPQAALFLIVEPSQVAALGDATLDADELLCASLSAQRVIAATRVGEERSKSSTVMDKAGTINIHHTAY
jgi:DNA-binding response OmpR family regulator